MKNETKHFISATITVVLMAACCVAIYFFGMRKGVNLERGNSRQRIQQQFAENNERIMVDVAKMDNSKLSQVLWLIENGYIDPISRDSLTELAIPAILGKLDPHSVYLPPKELEAAEEPLKGEFDGIGIVFNMSTDTVLVILW